MLIFQTGNMANGTVIFIGTELLHKQLKVICLKDRSIFRE